MEARWVLLFLLVLFVSQIQLVSYREQAPSPCINVVPVPDLKDPCGNTTILCTQISSSLDRFVPLCSLVVSFIVFFVPCSRVKRLQPNDRGETCTLFWWFLFLGTLDYILWAMYLYPCRFTHYATFPVYLSCILGAVVHWILGVVATVKTSTLGDQRLRSLITVPILAIVFGYSCADKHIVGWFGVALSVLSHSCRIGSTDYYANFDKWLFGTSIAGSMNGFLWLLHPQLCISREYKIASYIIGCFRGLESFLWLSRFIARKLSKIEGEIIEPRVDIRPHLI